jgi:hypothetical protein
MNKYMVVVMLAVVVVGCDSPRKGQRTSAVIPVAPTPVVTEEPVSSAWCPNDAPDPLTVTVSDGRATVVAAHVHAAHAYGFVVERYDVNNEWVRADTKLSEQRSTEFPLAAGRYQVRARVLTCSAEGVGVWSQWVEFWIGDSRSTPSAPSPLPTPSPKPTPTPAPKPTPTPKPPKPPGGGGS